MQYYIIMLVPSTLAGSDAILHHHARTLAGSNAGKLHVVFIHDEGDKEEVKVGAMRGKQHNRPLLDCLAKLRTVLNVVTRLGNWWSLFPYLFYSSCVDVNSMKDILNGHPDGHC